jgi:hypothetical protein
MIRRMIYCCIALLLVCSGCKDRDSYRLWTDGQFAVVNDTLYLAITREYGRSSQPGPHMIGHHEIEKIDCYVIEFAWPLQKDHPNAPIGGRRIDGCGGALTPFEATQFIRALEGFEREPGEFGPGLPRQVDAEVEQELQSKVDGDIFASAIVAGRELFLIRSRSLRQPDVIVTAEGATIHELPRPGITSDSIWNPTTSTVVYFDEWRSREDLELPDYINLPRTVIVYNYATGELDRFRISVSETLDLLLALEKK